MPVDDLPASAQAALKQRIANQRVYCPTRNRWLQIETEQQCAEQDHREAAVVLMAEVEQGVRRGRWDDSKQRYVAWE